MSELHSHYNSFIKDAQLPGWQHYSDFGGPARVPAWLQPRLEAMANSLGYHVRICSQWELPSCALGVTSARMEPEGYTPHTIDLSDGLTPAGLARVTCHELGHALLNEAASHTREQRCQRQEDNRSRRMAANEEVAVEIAAALVCRSLGINEGDTFSEVAVGRALRYDQPIDLNACRDWAFGIANAILAAVA
jgi:hypothetical protein